jgi:hypothetical protein
VRSASVNFVAAIPHLLELGTCIPSHRKAESANMALSSMEIRRLLRRERGFEELT